MLSRGSAERLVVPADAKQIARTWLVNASAFAATAVCLTAGCWTGELRANLRPAAKHYVSELAQQFTWPNLRRSLLIENAIGAGANEVARSALHLGAVAEGGRTPASAPSPVCGRPMGSFLMHRPCAFMAQFTVQLIWLPLLTAWHLAVGLPKDVHGKLETGYIWPVVEMSSRCLSSCLCYPIAMANNLMALDVYGLHSSALDCLSTIIAANGGGGGDGVCALWSGCGSFVLATELSVPLLPALYWLWFPTIRPDFSPQADGDSLDEKYDALVAYMRPRLCMALVHAAVNHCWKYGLMSLCLHQQLHVAAGRPVSQVEAAAELTRSGAWLAGSVGSLGCCRALCSVGFAVGALFEQEQELWYQIGEWAQRGRGADGAAG